MDLPPPVGITTRASLPLKTSRMASWTTRSMLHHRSSTLAQKIGSVVPIHLLICNCTLAVAQRRLKRVIDVVRKFLNYPCAIHFPISCSSKCIFRPIKRCQWRLRPRQLVAQHLLLHQFPHATKSGVLSLLPNCELDWALWLNDTAKNLRLQMFSTSGAGKRIFSPRRSPLACHGSGHDQTHLAKAPEDCLGGPPTTRRLRPHDAPLQPTDFKPCSFLARLTTCAC